MAKEFLLVDGYNIIFDWDELRQIADSDLESARTKLADILCNYQGFVKNEIILVFDGYKSKGNLGSVIHYHNIDIVYTKEAQTADAFIEAVSYQMARTFNIRVATSDGLEQMIILAKGAVRMSAPELKREIENANKEIKTITEENYRAQNTRNSLIDNLPPDVAKFMNDLRLKE